LLDREQAVPAAMAVHSIMTMTIHALRRREIVMIP